jgi:Fur family transcriptional regulator, ferric uptake regulator
MTSTSQPPSPWSGVHKQLRSRGLRWTPQRRSVIEVLAASSGHVTGAEVVQRCRERDADTTASTVYRTLDVLEELGYLCHSHGAGGREEYHVLPESVHAHLHCEGCGETWEIAPAEARQLVEALEGSRSFTVDLGHLTISGRCGACTPAATAQPEGAAGA